MTCRRKDLLLFSSGFQVAGDAGRSETVEADKELGREVEEKLGLAQGKDLPHLLFDIARPHEITDDGGGVGAGFPDLGDVVFGNAADGDERDLDGFADLSEHRQSPWGVAGRFGGGPEDRSEADVAGAARLCFPGLVQVMGGYPDDSIRSQNSPGDVQR